MMTMLFRFIMLMYEDDLKIILLIDKKALVIDFYVPDMYWFKKSPPSLFLKEPTQTMLLSKPYMKGILYDSSVGFH